MKLSEIKGEAALDVLADVMDPLTALLADPNVKKVVEGKKPKLIIAKSLIKDHKKEIVEIFAILNQKTPEEYMESMSITSLITDTLDLLNDKELTDFLELQTGTKE